MSSIESTSDYTAVPIRPDVGNLIFDFVIPAAGHSVVNVSIFRLRQNYMVTDVPVDWRVSHIERHTGRPLHQEMWRFHKHLLWENSQQGLSCFISGLSCTLQSIG